jgi:outer membrane protein assembly factor BamB
MTAMTGPIFGSSAYATPAVTAGGAIYLGLAGSFLGDGFFSFNENSNENWFFLPSSGQIYAQNGNNKGNVDSSAAVSKDGTIYFLDADWRFYGLYPDGNVKWYLPMPGHTQPDSSPAISGDGSIVCGSCSPYVYDVNPDGSLNWSCHIPNTNDQMELIYSPPVIDICDSY